MAEHNQQFDSFQQWVNKASSWLTRHADYHPSRFQAICFDAKGRRCAIGRDFMRARDEGTFPIRWLWPDQVAEMAVKLAGYEAKAAPADAPAQVSDAERQLAAAREAMWTARELLIERIQGSPARSPSHNARLVLDAALSDAPAPVGEP